MITEENLACVLQQFSVPPPVTVSSIIATCGAFLPPSAELENHIPLTDDAADFNIWTCCWVNLHSAEQKWPDTLFVFRWTGKYFPEWLLTHCLSPLPVLWALALIRLWNEMKTWMFCSFVSYVYVCLTSGESEGQAGVQILRIQFYFYF